MKRFCLTIATLLVAMGFCASVNAQYIWLDKNNVKHYSDYPPPTDIPNSRILKSPRGGVSSKNIGDSSSNSGPATNGATTPPKKQGPMTTAEKNADYNKRKMEQADKDKKAAEEKQRTEAKAQNCARAREYQRTLNSGQRISRTNKDGDREYLNDDERAKESNTVNDALKDCN